MSCEICGRDDRQHCEKCKKREDINPYVCMWCGGSYEGFSCCDHACPFNVDPHWNICARCKMVVQAVNGCF